MENKRAVMDAYSHEIIDAEAALREQGIARNTKRAYASDLRYWRLWYEARLGVPLPLPTPIEHLVLFVTDHIGAMPESVEVVLLATGTKTKVGPHRYTTVRRRLAALGAHHVDHGHADPTTAARIRTLLQRARRATRAQPGQRKRALLLADIQRIAAACDESLRGRRDRALIYTAFFSGGRRRSELADLRIAHVVAVDGGYLLRLDRSKSEEDSVHVPLTGAGARVLRDWLTVVGQQPNTPLFPRIVGDTLGPALSAAGINSAVKRRAAGAGYDAATISSHSLRGGFLTECGRQGMHLGDAMALSRHAALNVVIRHYYQAGAALANPAARLAGTS